MENNDKKDILITSNKIFKYDFDGQNVKNTSKFQTWEHSMKEIYGNNGKLFKCLFDKIYYYSTNDDCKNSYYLSPCPICKKNSCYFCSTFCKDVYGQKGSCCIKRRIKCIFLQDKLIYVSQNQNEENINLYKKAFIIFFIPFLSFLIFIGRIQSSFFYGLTYTKYKLDEKGCYIPYKETLSHKNKYLVVTINVVAASFLTIPFLIINIYIIIIVWIFSIPIKLIPIRHFIGIIYGDI